MNTTTQSSGLSYSAVRGYAERVGDEHKIYDDRGCANIGALLASLGGRVENRDSAESLVVRDKNDFTICIPTHTSMRRDRFTIAHELGHYFLHYRYPEAAGHKTYNRGGSNRAETEANVFAASLLMPERYFRLAFDELGGDPWLLSKRFNVSPAAAEVRIKTLGLAYP